MKIKLLPTQKKVFGDIKSGEIFMVNNHTFMKLDGTYVCQNVGSNNGNVNAVALTSSCLTYFTSGVVVEPISGEFVEKK